MISNQSGLSGLLSALADPTRRGILERLHQGPCSVGALAKSFPVTRSAVSQHLKVLKDAHLVSETRSGQQNIYSVHERASELFSDLACYAAQISGAQTPVRNGEDPDEMSVQQSSNGSDTQSPLEIAGVDWHAISDETEPEVVALIARMFIVGRNMEKLFASASARYDLNVGEVMILGTLRRLGGDGACTPTLLGKKSLISLPGIAKRLNRLEQMSLVERVVDVRDRRSSQVKLTAEGHRVFLAISHEQFSQNYAAFKHLPMMQRQQLDAVLRYLQTRMPVA